jgi:uncharacterized membrane protein
MMTKAKFTPGPWKIALPDDTIILDGEGNQVARTLGEYVSDYRRMEMDAALIAASPTMYEALDACQKALAMLTNSTLDQTSAAAAYAQCRVAELAARTALTKARGGA